MPHVHPWALGVIVLVLCASGCGPGTAASVGSCGNGVRDGNETDVDCGGAGCFQCAVGKRCLVSADCIAATCVASVCTSSAGPSAAVACGNGVKDGAETDVDCGGGTCPRCALGRRCELPNDCTGGACVGGLCAAASSCSNLVRDGDETDVDCGGSCSPCAVGRACRVGRDCASGSCDSGGHCVQPTSTPLPAISVYRISSDPAQSLIAPGLQAGFGISALGDGAFRIVWTGDGVVSGQFHQFDGSLFTDGSISATAGCSDQSCRFDATNYLSLSYDVSSGARVDFSASGSDDLEGFEVAVSGGASNGQTVYLELYIDGQPIPGVVFFVSPGGQWSSPLTIPFGLTVCNSGVEAAVSTRAQPPSAGAGSTCAARALTLPWATGRR
jgi:hypothetical protein